MTERDIRERELRQQEIRRRKKKKKKRRQALMVRFMCLFCVIVFCAGIGALASAMAKRQTKAQEAVAASVAAEKLAEQERQAAEEHEKWLEDLPEIGVLYGIYVPGREWSLFFPENAYCMAPVDGYINAFRAAIQNQPPELTGTLEYCANLSGQGWLDWRDNGQDAGDTAVSAPLEAIRARLTGELATYYDVLYSVLQDGGWSDWVMNGADAGIAGAGLQVDGIRISVVKKKEGQISYAGSIDPEKPMIALTYDDGPSGSATPRILAKLQEYGARATFFMVGQKAEKHPEIIRQMAAQGCEVANHTYDHTLMSKVDPVELASQLQRTNLVVAEACGVTPALMRPCGGERNEAGMMAVGAVSMPAVLWSVDTLDWKTRDAQNTIQVVLDQAKDGDIILMHDLYDATADASDTIIPELINRGFQLVTVSELSSCRGGMLPGKSYSKFRP